MCLLKTSLLQQELHCTRKNGTRGGINPDNIGHNMTILYKKVSHTEILLSTTHDVLLVFEAKRILFSYGRLFVYERHSRRCRNETKNLLSHRGNCKKVSVGNWRKELPNNFYERNVLKNKRRASRRQRNKKELPPKKLYCNEAANSCLDIL